uniref:ATP-binding cassette domain-containing protein n=1 Tax=Blautia argi TaxID=1912897 RepID=UPI002E8E1F51|nr:ATP-binding cassette domain-containing protein [Blautia argi]
MPHTGTFCADSNLLISYVPQNTSFLKGSLSDFALQYHIEESLFKTILRKLDFERTQLQMDMQLLSEGQKKKVLIAKSLCEQAHLYVWDEPLNFIDIYSRMQIEELLLEFTPAMIFVEHDQTFCRKIATKTLDLQ